MDIGTRIARLRKLHDLNQKELAHKLNIPTTTLSGYENNHREPPLDVLKDITNIFNISIDFLINGKIGVIEEKIDSLVSKLISGTLNGNIVWLNVILREISDDYSSIFTDEIFDSILDSFENITKENIKNFYCHYGEKNNFILFTLENIKNKCDITYLCVDQRKYEDNKLDSYSVIKLLAQDDELINMTKNKDYRLTYSKNISDLLIAIQSKETGEFEYLDSLIDSLDFD